MIKSLTFIFLCLMANLVNSQFWRSNNYGTYPNYGSYYPNYGSYYPNYGSYYYGNGNRGYGNGYSNGYGSFPYGNNYRYGTGSYSNSFGSPSDTEIFGFGRRFGHTDRVGGNAGLGYGCLAGCKNAVFGR